jgi:hypothetical protein
MNVVGRILPKKEITPQRALEEFRVAVEIWFGYMDEQTKRDALEIARKASEP